MHKIYVELPGGMKDHGMEVTHLKIEVGYQKAGVNWATGAEYSGGIYLFVTPVERKDGFEKMILITGAARKAMLEPMNRLNRNKVYASFKRVEADLAAGIGKVSEVINSVKGLLSQ